MEVTPASRGSSYPGKISTHHGGRKGGRKESVVVVRDELVPVLCSLLSRRSSKVGNLTSKRCRSSENHITPPVAYSTLVLVVNKESSCIVAIAIPIDGPSTISLLYSIYTSGPPSSPP